MGKTAISSVPFFSRVKKILPFQVQFSVIVDKTIYIYGPERNNYTILIIMSNVKKHSLWQLTEIRYWPTWLGFLCLRLMVFLPYTWLCRIGKIIGHLTMLFAKKRRKIAEINLSLCFPELLESDRKALIKAHFESLGVALFEIPMGWWGSDNALRGLAHVQGLKHLEDALKQGKGVILLSAHFTSMEIGARLLTLFLPFHVMYRSHKNPVMEKFIAKNRAKRCEKAIRRDDVRGLIRSLRDGKAIWYAPDQNTQRKQAVFVKFFGHLASTNSATARLTKLTGAAVVPFQTIRRAGGDGYDLILEPALDNYPVGNLKADTQQINDIIEGWVRENPEQYLWIHRRFRSRPSTGDPPIYRTFD